MRPHRLQPTRLPRPWDSPGKNTGVGCHFLLQCMKVKSESEVTQSCPTLVTPWTTAYQAPPSMGFCRQKYWSSMPLPSLSVAVMSNSLWPHGLQHARLPCPSLSPRVCPSSCPLSWWCYLTIPSSTVRFSFYLQPFPASESFLMSQLFASGGQSIGASTSTSVLAVNIQGWFPLRLTSVISLQSKGLSRVFSSTTVWKHQFFSTQSSFWSNSHICTWLLEKA